MTLKTKEQYIAESWLSKNHIKVYSKLIQENIYIIFYEIKNICYTNGKEYNRNEIDNRLDNFILYLYNKFSNV
tara:strand:+ start:1706 stop:1924 length:219 start_codon:yes stop_codon:yes gene_type:complete